jgi:hypothetical protein
MASTFSRPDRHPHLVDLDNVLEGIFVLARHLTTGSPSTILSAAPDYFVGNNIAALLVA